MGQRSRTRRRATGTRPRRRSGARKRRRKVPVQAELDLKRDKNGQRRGGERAGSGRKPKHERAGVRHSKRPKLGRNHPVHVTIRCGNAVGRLRNRKCFKAIERSILRAHKAGFSVAHFSTMTNHLHLIVEAEDEVALSRGIAGLEVRLAKALNRLAGRKGKVFPDRYHARILRTPLEVKNAIQYVLNNSRKHAAEHGRTLAAQWVDPYSSGPFFDGWIGLDEDPANFAVGPPVTHSARTWLLRAGWRRRGAIAVDAVPSA